MTGAAGVADTLFGLGARASAEGGVGSGAGGGVKDGGACSTAAEEEGDGCSRAGVLMSAVRSIASFMVLVVSANALASGAIACSIIAT